MLDFHETWPPIKGKVSFTPEVRALKTPEEFFGLGRFTGATLMRGSQGDFTQKLDNAVSIVFSLAADLRGIGVPLVADVPGASTHFMEGANATTFASIREHRELVEEGARA